MCIGYWACYLKNPFGFFHQKVERGHLFSWHTSFKYCVSRLMVVSIREVWRYQIEWIFGKVLKGGRSFSIQKSILQILDLYKGFFRMFSKKVAIWFSENEGRGIEGRLEFFLKFIWFGSATLPLAKYIEYDSPSFFWEVYESLKSLNRLHKMFKLWIPYFGRWLENRWSQRLINRSPHMLLQYISHGKWFF